jgi:hypothetical protein
MKYLFKLLLFIVVSQSIHAQELEARLTVISTRVGSQVDKKVFQSMQASLNTFLNNRRWTNNTFQAQEKIKCNFVINIDEYAGNNVFKATLTVQAARPIYNTSYESPIINLQDPNFQFKYVEFQPLEFNENRVQGNDPLAANITAMLAYYSYVILGLDYDSFAPRAGDPYFQKAQFIVNNAPEASEISGWKAFDGIRNRYKLIEGLVSKQYTLVHDALYAYYRLGMDHFYENDVDGRIGVMNALNYINTINSDNPNSMIVQVFFQGKSSELYNIFSRADQDIKIRARDLLVRLDLTNADSYKQLR